MPANRPRSFNRYPRFFESVGVARAWIRGAAVALQLHHWLSEGIGMKDAIVLRCLLALGGPQAEFVIRDVNRYRRYFTFCL